MYCFKDRDNDIYYLLKFGGRISVSEVSHRFHFPHLPLNLIDTHLFSPSNRTHHVIWCVWTQSRKSKHSRVVDRVTLGSSSQVESRPLTAGWDDTEQSYTELFAPNLNDQTWTFRCVCAVVWVVAGRVGLSAEHFNTCREKRNGSAVRLVMCIFSEVWIKLLGHWSQDDRQLLFLCKGRKVSWSNWSVEVSDIVLKLRTWRASVNLVTKPVKLNLWVYWVVCMTGIRLYRQNCWVRVADLTAKLVVATQVLIEKRYVDKIQSSTPLT